LLDGGAGLGVEFSSDGVITSSEQETIDTELDIATRRIKRIFFIIVLFKIYHSQVLQIF